MWHRLNKIYNAFLWVLGFKEGEKITYMLRRQKQRLGKFWWVGVGGVFASLICLVLHIVEVF